MTENDLARAPLRVQHVGASSSTWSRSTSAVLLGQVFLIRCDQIEVDTSRHEQFSQN